MVKEVFSLERRKSMFKVSVGISSEEFGEIFAGRLRESLWSTRKRNPI